MMQDVQELREHKVKTSICFLVLQIISSITCLDAFLCLYYNLTVMHLFIYHFTYNFQE